MTDRSEPALARLVHILDKAALWSGWLVSWLIIPMVLALVYEVVARYFFNAPTVWAYDVTFITYGTFFMLGSAYALQRGGHIRTDSYYAQWSPSTQGMVDTICYLFFFFPPLLIFLSVTWDFFWISYLRDERSVTSPWLPRIWPLKAVMPATCALLLIQGAAELIRSVHAWRTGVWIARFNPTSASDRQEERPSV
ncbi:MAG: TRAP transporter small permease subunit [Hyphomonadaceae bacterium]|jgi:TRAP-type mannitol/chloroaromatic compound transport system permease small subunit|nr:TRAP transporter small permease subunit [Hyphomonadaceae bacterium]